MAHRLRPKWYPQRRCFRVRKTVRGKVKAYLGGYNASGPDDEAARSRAFFEIEQKIAADESKLDGYVGLLKDQTARILENEKLRRQATKADESLAENMMEPEKAARAPIIVERDQLRLEVARLRAELATLGRVPGSVDLPLAQCRDRYGEIRTAEGQTNNLTPSTIAEYKKSAARFVEFLAEHGIETSAQLDKAAATVAEYRDSWLEKIKAGDSSKGLARRMLLGARQFMDWMHGRNYIARMPTATMKGWANVGTDQPKKAFLTIAETRKLYKKADARLRIGLLLGLNCGYRLVDIRSLKRSEINLEEGIIDRKRHKTSAPQLHKLWPETIVALKVQLNAVDGDPFATGWSNISRELTAFMKANVPQKPKPRTAENLRDTGANELDKLLQSKHPRMIGRYLGQQDRQIARHYRDEDTTAYFQALLELGERFALKA